MCGGAETSGEDSYRQESRQGSRLSCFCDQCKETTQDTFEIKQESFLFIIILVTEICSLGWTPGEVRRGSSAETLEHLSRVHMAGTGYSP